MERGIQEIQESRGSSKALAWVSIDGTAFGRTVKGRERRVPFAWCCLWVANGRGQTAACVTRVREELKVVRRLGSVHIPMFLETLGLAEISWWGGGESLQQAAEKMWPEPAHPGDTATLPEPKNQNEEGTARKGGPGTSRQ